MRMWMVDPRKMCDQHLLGEHVELHMLVGTLIRKRSVAGFVANKLIEVHNVRLRHAELVVEMTRRGMKHQSPLPSFRAVKLGKVSVRANLLELARRCENCRMKRHGGGRAEKSGKATLSG
ncbi:MAG: pyrimidine dimer DNA glycosylase/endonuclease V [Terriglobales bacterium]